MGRAVRYDGSDQKCAHPTFEQWQAESRLVPLCPEVQGGLPIPRPPAEVQGGNGEAVLLGASQVLTIAGDDVTRAFAIGAEAALDAARRAGAKVAILKANSPSCGSHHTYDGTFSNHLVPGRGVTAALLEAHGIRVFDETEIEGAAAALQSLED